MPTIRPINSHIGAQVLDVDLSIRLDETTKSRLNQALLDHLVLVFPKQTLTPQQYRDALGSFGTPMRQHRERFNLDECPDVSIVVNRDGFPPAIDWHTDHTNHERPPKITALHGVTIPEHGGDTAFANMYLALEQLPLEEREALSAMYTVNSMEPHASYSATDRQRFSTGVRHPMVRRHPETGRPALYFHVSKSQRIDGMAQADVRPYLESLLERTIPLEHTYRHRWQPGDVLICDNRAAMHRVFADYDPSQYRLLWRVIIEGDRPVGVA
jgi:taurine dioxygenase